MSVLDWLKRERAEKDEALRRVISLEKRTEAIEEILGIEAEVETEGAT